MNVSLKQRELIWKEFLKRWPVETIKKLTIEEYIDVNNKDTFAYWLEHKTNELGSIRGGNSSKFGIYRRKKPPIGSKKYIKHGQIYSWNTKFGEDEIEVFENVKNSIIKVIQFIEEGNVKEIENLKFADTVKWKIAFLYQNQSKPIVINIFKKDMLREACSDATGDFTELYATLLEDIGDTNIIQYGYNIWTSLELDDELLNSEVSIENSGVKPELSSLNTILYGPPGTGKTYSTINKALEILEPDFLLDNLDNRHKLKARFDELLKSNRIGFITFHQSFSYEDFVEGIKADTEDGKVHYSIEDGIFKSMCEAASVKVKTSSDVVNIDVSNRKIWKMSLGDTLGEDAYIYQQCIDSDYVVLGYGYKLDFSAANTRAEVMNIYNENGVEVTRAC